MKVERREMADEVYNLNPPTYTCVWAWVCYIFANHPQIMFEIPGGREGAPAATAWLLALLDVMGGVNHNCHQERAKYPLDHQGPCDAEAEPKI